MNRWSVFVPLGVFVLLVSVFYAGFWLGDPHKLPSALLDREFPEFDLPRLDDPERHVQRDALLGETTLVNVWATWCPTCRAEHHELLRIARESGIRIIGINYKDDPAAARRWLAELGDPYEFSIIDRDGRLGIDLGVYGAPETFVVDAGGVIRLKRVGDVNRRVWEGEMRPAMQAMGLLPRSDGSDIARADG